MFIEFKPKLPKMTKTQTKVLSILVEAAKLVQPLYQEQEDQAEKGELGKLTNFSPYMIGEIPYHVKYARFLEPIAHKLNEAAQITENKEFGNALKTQAQALLDGSYEKATIIWLKLKPYFIDISIGPVDHYDDQIFHGKASYQAWVGVVNEEDSKRLNKYKSIVLSTRRKAGIPAVETEKLGKVKAKVLETIIFSGLMAKIKFVGVNLPMDLNIVEKHGSEITLFNQPNDLRMKEQIMPTFHKIFTSEFKRSFEVEDLRRGNLRYIALHEMAHSYLYYKDAYKNLGDLFDPIYELAATVLGFRMAGSLLLKDVINNKQLESMIVVFLCRSLDLAEKNRVNKNLRTYALGGVIFINYLLESGALKRHNNKVVLNFIKVFVSIHELSDILERLLSSGTKKEVENFVKKYGQLK